MKDTTTAAHEFTPLLDDELFSAALDDKLGQGMDPIHAIDNARKQLGLDRLTLVQAITANRLQLSERGRAAVRVYLSDIQDEVEGS